MIRIWYKIEILPNYKFLARGQSVAHAGGGPLPLLKLVKKYGCRATPQVSRVIGPPWKKFWVRCWQLPNCTRHYSFNSQVGTQDFLQGVYLFIMFMTLFENSYKIFSFSVYFFLLFFYTSAKRMLCFPSSKVLAMSLNLQL